ncbi:MAG: GDSL-type esterase/lipase family protein [Phycisphaerae bacterium]
MMKRIAAAALVMMMGLCAAGRAQTQPGESTKPTIFVCGDSTSKFHGGETTASEMQGWGTPLSEFFDPAKVTVKNMGHAGTSSRTFFETDWPKVISQVKPGDFVLIVFGINDGGLGTPPGLGDETKTITVRGKTIPDAHTYGWYMSKMASDVKEKGAHPVLLTVTTRNIWTNPEVKYKDATPVTTLPADYDPKQDKIERGTGNGRYGEWTKEVGAKLHVPVFDLTNYCADEYEGMGREAVNKLYRDHNHTYGPGAKIVAEAVVSGLKALKDSPFVPLLSDAGKQLPTADRKYVSENASE